MTLPLPRVFTALGLGAVAAFGLLWVMQALVSVDYKLLPSRDRITVDFVRLRRDSAPDIPPRQKPERQKPEHAPTPPEVNTAKVMNPSGAVSEIVPLVDAEAALDEVTNLDVAGGSDRGILPLVRIDPEYPPRAKQQGIEGWVELEFTITPAGTVDNAAVTAADPSFIFDQAALQAVRKWRYNSKIENGVAVARHGVQVRLRFELAKGR